MITRNVVLEVDGLKIGGQLYLPGKDEISPCPAVCICHGIPSGNPPDPADGGYPLLAERICQEGLAVFIFNFRGTGISGGNLDMTGWARDLKAVIDYLYALPEIDRAHISLLGFSGGAAVSVFVAAQDKRVASVIACACPAGFSFMTGAEKFQSLIDHFRHIGAIRDKDFPPSAEAWLNGFKLVSPINYVADISPRPLLLVHGSHDETVAVNDARKMYERAGEPRHLEIVEGAGHRLRQNDRAMTIVTDWLKSR